MTSKEFVILRADAIDWWRKLDKSKQALYTKHCLGVSSNCVLDHVEKVYCYLYSMENPPPAETKRVRTQLRIQQGCSQHVLELPIMDADIYVDLLKRNNIWHSIE